MKTPFSHYMKLGIVHFMAYPFAMTGDGDIERTMRRIMEDADFECIEVTRINDLELRGRIRDMAEQSGITLTYGAQPQLLRNQENINSLDEELRVRAVNRLKVCIDEAYEVDAKGFAFLAGKYDEGKVEEHYQALVRSTHDLCDYAAQKGNMPMLLEVFDYDVEKFSLIGPIDITERYAQEMSAEYSSFGLMVDLSHIAQLHSGIDANIDPIASYIRHVHFANAVLTQGEAAYGDQHPRFGFPNSVVDEDMLAVFFRKLFAIGYLAEGKRPIVSFEIKPWENENSELAIANAKRFLRAAWARV